MITFVRGETILLALPLVVVWAVASRSWLTGLRYGAIALAATAMVILPWVVRNWVRMGYPILMSTGSGENLIAGHWPGADGKGSFVPILEVDKMYAGVPFPKNETLVYKEETRRAISFALHNPATELELIPQKLFEFYRGDGKVHATGLRKERSIHPAFSHRRADRAGRRWRMSTTGRCSAMVAAGIPLWLSLRDPRRLLLLMVGALLLVPVRIRVHRRAAFPFGADSVAVASSPRSPSSELPKQAPQASSAGHNAQAVRDLRR